MSSSFHMTAGGRPMSFEALVDPGASTRLRARRGWVRDALYATARWLRHNLAESARAWALAAGVPPHLYP